MRIDDRVEKILTKIKLQRFRPLPFARSGLLQTVYGFYWPYLKAPTPNFFHHILLPDGDILVASENRPSKWKEGDRVMLLIHGAGGNYLAPYMQRMCRRLYGQGYLVLRLNLRCCGPSLGVSKTPYHMGQSDDTRHVVKWISQKFPGSPVTQIGFSMGANITLKMAGEDGSRPAGNLDSVVAVSPPLNISAAMDRLSLPQNRVIQRSFLNNVQRQIRTHHKYFPEFKPFDLPANINIKSFHEHYTAPMGGFKNAADYYQKSSAFQFVPEIKVPSLILCAADDPVVDGAAVARVPHTNNLDVILTEHGGHIGFLGFGSTWDEIRWCDEAIARWLENTVAS